ENTPYPKAGDPNPLVKLGIAPVTGDSVRWVDLAGYPPPETLVIRAGFTPDGARAYFYVQDRAQTWLDFCTVPAAGGAPTKLFRETTKAWVEALGPPSFLKDGSFLVLSERTGFKHIYHYEKTGELRRALTSGDWELTSGLFVPHPLLHVDEAGGWVYFLAKKDSPIASNLYRVPLAGGAVERLSDGPGDHHVSLSPNAKYFVDSYSSHTT